MKFRSFIAKDRARKAVNNRKLESTSISSLLHFGVGEVVFDEFDAVFSSEFLLIIPVISANI